MLSSITISRAELFKAVVLDFISVVAIYFIPTVCHLTSLPLYLFDPMRIVVLIGFLAYRNRWNSCILALTLPLVSFLFSGHPIAIKNAIIAVELLTNVILLSAFLNTRLHRGISVALSIIISKAFYYLLKYVAISTLLLNTDLVSTEWIYQISVVGIICIAWLIFGKQDKGTR